MKKNQLLYGLEAAGGGALKHLVYLVTRLDKEIFDITVILSNLRNENITDEIKLMENSGAEILFLPMTTNINPIKDFLTICKLISVLRKKKYQIVHAQSSKAGGIFRLAAWLCRIPATFYTPHCFYFQGKTGFQKRKYVLLERILAKTTTKIIVSEDEKKEAIKNGIVDVSKTININNAIDFDEYQQCKEIEKTKERLGIKENAFIVGAIGRLVPQKDWETYIYAANVVLQLYPDTVFLIVGEGELRNEILKLIFKLNLDDKIILTGYVKEIHKIYGIIDIFVNTSLWEGLPYVFLEAMRYKRPIIATNTGNEAIIIHGESGFLSPVKDYQAIARKIALLLDNKQIAIRMGKKGIEKLTQKYSFELFIQKHEELYKKHISIIKQKKGMI